MNAPSESVESAPAESVEPMPVEPEPAPVTFLGPTTADGTVMTLDRYKAIRAARQKEAAGRRRHPTLAAGVDLVRALAWMRRLPCLRHVGKVTLVVAHSVDRHSRGGAYIRQRKIRLRVGPEATIASTLGLLLHELVHLALPPTTHHGESFRRLLRVAAREAWGIDVSIDQAPVMGVIAYGMDEVVRAELSALVASGAVDTFPPAAPGQAGVTTPVLSRAEHQIGRAHV